jgi:hypothetical protein
MRIALSRTTLVLAASVALSGLVGCASDEQLPSRTHAVLTDIEAARLAELHLNDTAPEASPRDVVSLEQSYQGKGHIVGFHTFFDETQTPPKQSRLVMVEHDGTARELMFKD